VSAIHHPSRGLLATYGRDGLLQIILIANTALMLFPIAIMIMSGFKTNIEIFQSPFSIPDFTNLQNYITMATQTGFLRYLWNSFFVTTVSIVLILVLGTMAAYAVARYDFFGSSFVLLFFMAGLMVPLKLAIIPLFILFRDLGFLNSHLSLIAVYTAMGLPSTVFIMTGFIRTLPRELEDAARMDGASEARILWSVMVPLCRPATGDRGDLQPRADLERLLLPAGVHPERRAEDAAAGHDHLHRRIRHQLGGDVRWPHACGGTDHDTLHPAVAAVHQRHDGGGGEMTADSTGRPDRVVPGP
jgi:ABC-type spermidine/putrescine transport system permease subunit II